MRQELKLQRKSSKKRPVSRQKSAGRASLNAGDGFRRYKGCGERKNNRLGNAAVAVSRSGFVAKRRLRDVQCRRRDPPKYVSASTANIHSLGVVALGLLRRQGVLLSEVNAPCCHKRRSPRHTLRRTNAENCA